MLAEMPVDERVAALAAATLDAAESDEPVEAVLSLLDLCMLISKRLSVADRWTIWVAARRFSFAIFKTFLLH